MNTQTPLYAVMALVLAAGFAAAETTAAVANAERKHAEQTFAIGAEPGALRIVTNGSATFVLIAKTRVDQTLGFEVARHSGSGYEATLGETRVDAKPGEAARVKLLVTAGPEASREAAFQIVATNAEGERHATIVKVAMKPAEKTYDELKERAAEKRERSTDKHERVVAKHERAVEKRERAADERPAPAAHRPAHRAWLLIELDGQTDLRGLLEKLAGIGLHVKLVGAEGTA